MIQYNADVRATFQVQFGHLCLVDCDRLLLLKEESTRICQDRAGVANILMYALASNLRVDLTAPQYLASIQENARRSDSPILPDSPGGSLQDRDQARERALVS